MKIWIQLFIFCAALARASTIVLQSGVSPGESNNISGANYVIPTPEPVWAVGPGEAEWISFENTGWCTATNGACITLPNTTSLADPTAVFTQTFTDDIGTVLTGSVTVWADDSAAVYLDGSLISAPATLLQGPVHCSPASGITCTGDGTIVDFTTTPGTHTLTFDVYQTGGATFGLLYDGSVSDNWRCVPEPASWILLGIGLIAVGSRNIRRTG